MKDKYRAYSAEELIEELAYCGFDPYYNEIREPVVKEIFRRLEQWEEGELKRPKGKWVQQYKNDGGWHDTGYWEHMYKCSNCGSDGSRRFAFCPKCGFSMEEVVTI